MSRSLQFAHANELKEGATARRAGEEKLAKELKDRSAEAAAATARAEPMAMERAALAEQAKGAVEHAATLERDLQQSRKELETAKVRGLHSTRSAMGPHAEPSDPALC